MFIEALPGFWEKRKPIRSNWADFIIVPLFFLFFLRWAFFYVHIRFSISSCVVLTTLSLEWVKPIWIYMYFTLLKTRIIGHQHWLKIALDRLLYISILIILFCSALCVLSKCVVPKEDISTFNRDYNAMPKHNKSAAFVEPTQIPKGRFLMDKNELR